MNLKDFYYQRRSLDMNNLFNKKVDEEVRHEDKKIDTHVIDFDQKAESFNTKNTNSYRESPPNHNFNRALEEFKRIKSNNKDTRVSILEPSYKNKTSIYSESLNHISYNLTLKDIEKEINEDEIESKKMNIEITEEELKKNEEVKENISEDKYGNLDPNEIFRYKKLLLLNSPIDYPNIYSQRNNNCNFLNTPKLNFSLLKRQAITQINRKTTFIVCFICEYYSDSDLIYLADCSHSFCIICIKRFFERRITLNDSSLKCPLFDCKNLFKFYSLKKILSEIHYQRLLNLITEINAKRPMHEDIDIYEEMSQENGKQIEPPNNPVTTDRNLINPNNNNKNIIFLDNNINDYIKKYEKNKASCCFNCGQESLFDFKPGEMKCLNCFEWMCKYCLKRYEDGHFNINKKNHCRVYFRLNHGLYVISPAKRFCMNFLTVLLSYLIFITGICKNISCSLRNTFINSEYQYEPYEFQNKSNVTRENINIDIRYNKQNTTDHSNNIESKDDPQASKNSPSTPSNPSIDYNSSSEYLPSPNSKDSRILKAGKFCCYLLLMTLTALTLLPLFLMLLPFFPILVVIFK